MAMSNDEVVRLLLQVTGAEDLDDLRAKAAGAREKIDDLAAGADKAEKSTHNLGRATLEGGRILQDFAQGGVGGILNNIEGLSLALGGGPGLAGVMTALGLAAYFAIPAIKATWAAISDGSNEIPEAATTLDRLSESLSGVNDRLKELKEKGWLTDSELSEYNGKLAQRVELEEKITAEKEKQAVFDKSRKESESKDRDKESARIAQEIVDEAGGPDALAKRVAVPKILESQRSGELRKLMDEIARLDEEAKHVDENLPGIPGFRDTGVAGQRRALIESQRRKAVARSREIENDIFSSAEDDVAGALQGEPEAASRMLANDQGELRWAGATQSGIDLRRNREKTVKQVEKQLKDLQKDARKLDSEIKGAERDAERRKKDAEREVRRRGDDQVREMKSLLSDVDAKRDKDERDAESAARQTERDAEKAARQAERDAEKAARDALPGNRLQALREQAYQTAAGIAMAENNGEFSPAELQAIARQAADSTGSLDVASIRQAVYQSAAMVRIRIQQELDQNMRRMFQGGGFNYGGD